MPFRDENPEEAVIYPENASPFLFRGQNARYEPCFPTIARSLKNNSRSMDNLTQTEQAILILNLIKTQWFSECIRETPVFQWMKQKKLHLNETAVAQHYGIPTGYIDLSQSFDVASFFACCRYDQKNHTWEPVASGEGVIYVIDQRMVPLGLGAKPICLQPFPRPSEQWAWVHEVVLGDDFDKMPYVKKFIFRHDKNASQRILNKFSHGVTLFPPDHLATVANKVNKAQEASLSVALKVIKGLINDPQGLPGRLTQEILDMVKRETNITILDIHPTIIDDQIRIEMQTAWNQRKDSFLNGIGHRLVRTWPG